MAQKVNISITDDLDGSENAETVSFGFEGKTYEVDLAKKNRAKLEKALGAFIEAGRKTSAPRRSRAAANSSGPDRAVVRAWAKSQGIQVSERGRISAETIAKYEAAH